MEGWRTYSSASAMKNMVAEHNASKAKAHLTSDQLLVFSFLSTDSNLG